MSFARRELGPQLQIVCLEMEQEDQIIRYSVIAELQIKPKSKSNQTKNLEGTIIAWFLAFLFVTLRTVLMLLLPLKMLTSN